jgi:transcriptional regulator with XRE-family HTH domain
MSQQKKLELSKRVRDFRIRAKLSQEELGERLAVSGNYISMIELGKKEPGGGLQKLFEILEQSPLYGEPPHAGMELRDSASVSYRAGSAPAVVPVNPVFAMLSTETLEKNFVEVAEGLPRESGAQEKKRRVGSLREMLDEIEGRLMASSGALSEAQEMAVRAARGGGNRGTK